MEENETFVDVGANVGSYSLMVANEYKDRAVKVIAIEAHPDNYKALCRNIQCNKFENVIIPINKVVSNYKGLVDLYKDHTMELAWIPKCIAFAMTNA